MALGTLFTLLVIPSIYMLIAKQHTGEEPGALGREFESEAEAHRPAQALQPALARANINPDGNGN